MNPVESSDIAVIEVVTQAEYDALTPPSATTLYVIAEVTAPPPPPPFVVEDTFTDAVDVALEAHTGESGATWAKLTGFTGAMVVTDANRARKQGTVSLAYFASGVPTTADYDVEADFVVRSLLAGDAPAITGRQDPAANTCLRAQYAVSSGEWKLHQFVAGAATQLGTFTNIPTGTVRVKLQMRGTTVKVFLDGVERISAETAVAAAGRVGIRNAGSAAQANTTGIHIDSIVASNA
jgi:hypothetical protein